MSQFVDLDRMHVYEVGGTVVYQLLCGRDLDGSMANYIYLVVNTHDQTGIAIDAAWDLEAIYRFAKSIDVQIVGAVYTHFHADHAGGRGVAGCREVAERGCQIWAGEFDAEVIRSQCALADSGVTLQELRDGDVIPLGSLALHVLHTPGHTPGSICVLLSGLGAGALTPRYGSPLRSAVPAREIRVRFAASGDTLFVGGAGRADLFESNYDHLLESLVRLTGLEPNTVVLPGHNYDPNAFTTIDFERGGNPSITAALEKRISPMPLPPCCQACADSSRLGPLGWKAGLRTRRRRRQLAETAVVAAAAGGGSEKEEVGGEEGEEVLLVEAWSALEGVYIVRPLHGEGGRSPASRRTVPPECLIALGGGDAPTRRDEAPTGQTQSTSSNPPLMDEPVVVFYRVVHGTLLRKDDPISSSPWAGKVAASKRAVGSLVKTTGRTWTGQ
eukprot:CAMPEP_0115178404 /NCGR_PEP_ID=MMETSP0270-20121206/5883_1 /TAXON_ID=71861 /ORGANISM="Scrippsiella trochoidea, Strain CCMP3099" /LENGTH=442 /DNA_ID=CAMNT_0002591365 /DNA_START=9 /DNA_END=1335 /DNA_ORIENTATION=+